MDRRRLLKLTSLAFAGAVATPAVARPQKASTGKGLWSVWDSAFARARFVSLSHVLTPETPVWNGFPTTTKFRSVVWSCHFSSVLIVSGACRGLILFLPSRHDAIIRARFSRSLAAGMNPG